MSRMRHELESKAKAYAAEKGISLTVFLGNGNDGAVWATSRNSAVKVLERPHSYQRERDAYLQLKGHGVTEIVGFAVPQLIDRHDTLQIVEMTEDASPRR
jgi:hypothetical protein